MWDLIKIAQLQESEMAPSLFHDFMDEYIKT